MEQLEKIDSDDISFLIYFCYFAILFYPLLFMLIYNDILCNFFRIIGLNIEQYLDGS